MMGEIAMINVNDRIKESVSRTNHLKNQKKLKERREQEAMRKMDTRRYIIIGELVCKHFPEMMNYQPHRNCTDNKEFTVLTNILSLLAANKEMINKLNKDAINMTTVNYPKSKP